jgi:hypothetical protein
MAAASGHICGGCPLQLSVGTGAVTAVCRNGSFQRSVVALLCGERGRRPARATHLPCRLARAASTRLDRSTGYSRLCADAGCGMVNGRQRRVGSGARDGGVGVHSADATRARAWRRGRARCAVACASTAHLSHRGCVASPHLKGSIQLVLVEHEDRLASLSRETRVSGRRPLRSLGMIACSWGARFLAERIEGPPQCTGGV